MRKPIRKFFILSALAHLSFTLVSGFVFVTSSAHNAPIKVKIKAVVTVDNQDMASGRVVDLPEPEREEKPDNADILARFDSKAHSPRKGKKYKANDTSLPSEKINPPLPAPIESRLETPATRPDKLDVKIAALVDDSKKSRIKISPDVEKIFSETVSRKTPETEKTTISEKSADVAPGRSRDPSARITDNPTIDEEREIREYGAPGAVGGDLYDYAMVSTGDDIEMGDEAIVSFNTKSFKYVDYFESVRKAMELVWTYPETAIINGWSGKVMLRFTLSRSGELEGVRLVKSAGRKLLDNAAISAVKSAAPYDPFPRLLNKKRIHVVATFVYQPSFNVIR